MWYLCRGKSTLCSLSSKNQKWCHHGKEKKIECYQKYCPYYLWFCKLLREKSWILGTIPHSSSNLKNTQWGGETSRGGGGMWESEGKKQRFSSNEYLAGVLPESWLVCSSINSSVLYSSISLREEDVAVARGYSQGQLIGSSWLDPRSFSTS